MRNIFLALTLFFVVLTLVNISPVYAADDEIGNEILDVADSTLTRVGIGTTANPFTVKLNLGNSNAWTTSQGFSGGLTVGNSIFNNNSSLGIGTTSPGYALDVRNGGSISVTHSLNPFLRLAKTGSTARTWYLQALNDFISLNLSGSPLTGLNLNNNGNVGVGTTNQAEKLEVAGNIKVGSNSYIFKNIKAYEPNDSLGDTAFAALTLQPANGNKDAVFRFVPSGSAGGTVFELYEDSAQSSSTRGIVKVRGGEMSFGGDGGSLGINFIMSNNIKMKIDTSGNVGIGSSSPGQKLDIAGGNGRVESGYNWLTSSDARYKTNITTLEGTLERLARLRGVRFDLKTDQNITAGQGRHIGFIAQEVEKQYPELVVNDEKGYKSVAYDKVTAILVEAVKQQQKEIEQLQAEVKLLKSSQK